MTLLRAPAKLTLSLRVTGVRANGYHLIEAEMLAVDLVDELVIEEGDGLEVRLDGPALACGAPVPADDTNLVRRALSAVGAGAHVELRKRIPAGGGLGGGSADAAAILRWAGVSDLALAFALGGDVPVCLVGGRSRVVGAGEVVEPLPFEDRFFTLLVPPFGVSTAAVYAEWDAMGGPTSPGSNDLEAPALAVEPRLAEWRDRLGNATGAIPILAGSGSTWFVEGAHEGPGHLVVRTERGQAVISPGVSGEGSGPR